MAIIEYMERNARNAWVIYGVNGVKQYYGYTKQEAIRLYREEAQAEVAQFWNH